MFSSTIVSQIEHALLVGLGYTVEESTSLQHDCLISLEISLEVMIGVLQTLKSGIGSPMDIGEQFSAPTLSESTAFIADDLTRLSDDYHLLKSETILPMKASIARTSTNNFEASAKAKKVDKAIKLLLGRVLAINESVGEIKSKIQKLRASQAAVNVSVKNPRFLFEDTVDELMDFINSEDQVDHSPLGVEVEPLAKKITSNVDVRDNRTPDPTIMALVEKRTEDVKNLQSAKQNTVAIKFGGLGTPCYRCC